jgi:hypothetical protein
MEVQLSVVWFLPAERSAEISSGTLEWRAELDRWRDAKASLEMEHHCGRGEACIGNCGFLKERSVDENRMTCNGIEARY